MKKPSGRREGGVIDSFYACLLVFSRLILNYVASSADQADQQMIDRFCLCSYLVFASIANLITRLVIYFHNNRVVRSSNLANYIKTQSSTQRTRSAS